MLHGSPAPLFIPSRQPNKCSGYRSAPTAMTGITSHAIATAAPQKAIGHHAENNCSLYPSSLALSHNEPSAQRSTARFHKHFTTMRSPPETCGGNLENGETLDNKVAPMAIPSSALRSTSNHQLDVDTLKCSAHQSAKWRPKISSPVTATLLQHVSKIAHSWRPPAGLHQERHAIRWTSSAYQAPLYRHDCRLRRSYTAIVCMPIASFATRGPPAHRSDATLTRTPVPRCYLTRDNVTTVTESLLVLWSRLDLLVKNRVHKYVVRPLRIGVLHSLRPVVTHGVPCKTKKNNRKRPTRRRGSTSFC